MAYTKLLVLPSSMLLFMLGCINAQAPAYHFHSCNKDKYIINSAEYQANVDLLLSSLSSNTSTGTGFYSATAGYGSNKSYGLFLCRGDVSQEYCGVCMETGADYLKQNCQNTTTAIVWFDYCMVRYSNQSILSIMQENPVANLWTGNNVSDPDLFNPILGNLLDRLTSKASSGSSNLKYAADEQNYGSSQKVYGLVQCTPDLSQEDCSLCLNRSIAEIPNCCYQTQSSCIFKPSCLVIFQFNYCFYESVVTTEAPRASPTILSSPETTGRHGKWSNNSSLILVVTSVLLITTITNILISFLYTRFRRRTIPRNDEEEMITAESLRYHFAIIRAATDNFSDANKLGQGGFGAVYKGELPNGQMVAVKRLSINSGQGETEFKNEVLVVAKLQHRNLVRLVGYCQEGEESLLIYEFVPNRSLNYFIFDPNRRAQLNWERRNKIIGGIARGLLYLHEDSRLRIIHRDLKASNILLDDEMNPKIGDFGIAKHFATNQTRDSTNTIVGTCGYMAPEYRMHGRFSVKTDVFSFGLLLLEIVSGQRNDCFHRSEFTEDLLSHAWRLWREDKAVELIDPTLGESCPRTEVIRCIHIGLLCVQENVASRPTMASVVLMLNSNFATLPSPSLPAFLVHSRSMTARTVHSQDEASITELHPR